MRLVWHQVIYHVPIRSAYFCGLPFFQFHSRQLFDFEAHKTNFRSKMVKRSWMHWMQFLLFIRLGNWSSPPPTCSPVQCPSLFLEDPHLSLTELNTSAYGRAVFKCSWGYRLNGPSSVECESTGAWNGPVPRCRGLFTKSYLLVDTCCRHDKIRQLNIWM